MLNRRFIRGRGQSLTAHVKRAAGLLLAVGTTLAASALELVDAGWIDEDAATFAGRRAGTGSWTYRPGAAAALEDVIALSADAQRGDFVTFDDRVDSSGNRVEIESVVSFGAGNWNLPQLPADTQCSLTFCRDGLKVYSAAGWTSVSAAVDLADAEALHRLLFSLDYTARTFTVTIDGAPVTDAAGRRTFRLAGTQQSARTVGFGGAVDLRTVQGGARTASPASVSSAEVHAAFRHLPDHPRLHVAGPQGLAALRAASSPEAKTLRAHIVSAAEAALAEPPVVSSKVGKRLSGDSDATKIILVSAAGYALTGDMRYAARARDEMLSVCAWPDWVPSHYLGTAEVLRGLAFGYDWTFDALTAEERRQIRTTIVNRGFGGMSGWNGWDSNTTNWSAVCWQGVLAAALAIYEDDATEAEALVRRAIPALAKSCAPYAPNGAYPEGPGYWSYGTGRLCLILDQLDVALGTTFGLYELEGVAATGEYPLAMTGPTGVNFNYSDCGESKPGYQPAALYFATRANRPDWATHEYETIAGDVAGATSVTGVNALQSLFWARFPATTAESRTPLDYYGGGSNPVAVLRDTFASYGLFLGIKGGKVATNHGHMDVGSFVYEADGVRWAVDLGSQDYNALESLGTIDLWNMGQNSTRWNVFRLNQDSHNLVTLDGRRLKASARAEIDCISTGETGVASLDLTEVYGTDAVMDARRTFKMERLTRTVTVTDDFTGLAAGTSVRWAMVTRATEIQVDGATVHLAQGGARLDVTMTSSAPGGAWEVVDVSTGPNSWDVANARCRQLRYTLAAPSSGDVRLTAQLAPLTVVWPSGSVFYGHKGGVSALGTETKTGEAEAAIGWWTGPDTNAATQVDVPSPWVGAAAGYRYVLLSAQKITGTSVFPDVPISIGESDRAASLSFNGGIRFVVPDATVYGATFNGNSDKLTAYEGAYRLVKPGTSVTFAAANVGKVARGASLQGRFVADTNVTVRFTSTYVKDNVAPSTHRLAGDFSAFKGSVTTVKPSYGTGHSPYAQHMSVELTSPSALGDPTAPRADAFVFTDNVWLKIADAVDQSVPRGIRYSLAAGERGYLDAAEDWTLSATLAAPGGALVKEGAGRLTLAGALSAATLTMTNGTLAVAPTATLAVPQLTFCSGDARDAAYPLLTTADGGSTLTNSLTFALFGTNGESRCVFAAPTGTTNVFGGNVSVKSVAGVTNRTGLLHAGPDSETVFAGKFTTESAPVVVDGAGRVRFAGVYTSYSHLSVNGGEVVFERPQNLAYGFNLNGGTVFTAADDALKVSSEKSGHLVLLNGTLDIGSTTQRLWALSGSGTVRGAAGSSVRLATEADGEVVGCGVAFAGDLALTVLGGSWMLTGRSTASGDLRVSSGVVGFARNGSWAGTNVTVSATGALELANPDALSAAFGRLAVASGGTVTIPKGVVARVAALAVDGVSRTPGVYGSAEAAARFPGVTAESTFDGEGVLLVTGGDLAVKPPYAVTGVLEVTGDVSYSQLDVTRLKRLAVDGGTFGFNLVSGTVVRVTTIDLRQGARLELAAGVTVEAASVFADGVPVESGVFVGGERTFLLGEGTLKVLVVSAEHDLRAARVLKALRQAGAEGRWYASWLKPWSLTPFAVAKGTGYEPADPATIDLESTSAGYRISQAQPLLYFIDFNEIAGTWNGLTSYARQRAAMTALVKAAYRRWGAIPVFSWHPENPYTWTGFYDPTYGSAAYRCRNSSEGYPSEHRYVMKEILENTGGPCGLGRSTAGAKSDGEVSAVANPRAWFDARLDEISSFLDGLRDEKGRPIPVVSRLYHECEDSWQWWGADFVSVDDYRRIFRYTAEALRWRLGDESGRILFAYSPDRYCWPRDSKTKQYLADGAAEARTKFMSRYAGDDVTDIIGYDDYSIGDGATDEANELALAATIRQIALISTIADEHGKAAGLFETMGSRNRETAYFPWLYRAMKGEGCHFGFANTWNLPLPDTEGAETWVHGYLDRSEVLTVGHGQSLIFTGFTLQLR